MIEGLMAGLTSLLAVACIYWSWLKRGQAIVAATGWLLALGSAVVWSQVQGPEFGVTYAIIVFMCLIWLVVLFVANSPGMEARSDEVRGGEPAVRPYQALAWPQRSDVIKHGTLFLLSVPATGILTLMLSVATVVYLPWTLLNKIAVAVFLWPVLWGALSSWISAQQHIVRPAIVVAGLFCISALLLFI